MVAKGRGGRLSPDGRWLTYTDAEDWKRTFLADLDSDQSRELGLVRALAWSPDATMFAYSNGRQLLLADPKSGEPRELARGAVWSSSFSPDGKAIAFTQGDHVRSKLLVLRLADGKVSELTGSASDPVWGTSWIAFSVWELDERLGKDYGAVSTLYLVHPDGTGLHQLTIDDEIAGHGTDDFLRFGLVPIAFSSDGKRLLAGVAMELGPMELVTFAVPEGPGTKLTDAEDQGAIWTADVSPDGTQILFEDGGLDDEENHVIFAMPIDGGKRTTLVEHATQASWARGIPPTRDDAE
jgi:Tol biopolymer transport system component